MKTQKSIIVFLIIFSVLLTNSSPAMAMPPPLPSSFYGTVKVDGGNVPVGASITALDRRRPICIFSSQA